RPAPGRLAEGRFLLSLDRDHQPGTRVGRRQGLRHRLLHLGTLAEPRARALKALPQIRERFDPPLDRPGAPRPVLLGLPCTAIPEQSIALRMDLVIAADEQ